MLCISAFWRLSHYEYLSSVCGVNIWGRTSQIGKTFLHSDLCIDCKRFCLLCFCRRSYTEYSVVWTKVFDRAEESLQTCVGGNANAYGVSGLPVRNVQDWYRGKSVGCRLNEDKLMMNGLAFENAYSENSDIESKDEYGTIDVFKLSNFSSCSFARLTSGLLANLPVKLPRHPQLLLSQK